MIKNPNSENLHLHYITDVVTVHFVQKHKFSEAQLFLQQIFEGVIKGILFDYTIYCFHTYDTLLSFYGFTVHCFCLFNTFH